MAAILTEKEFSKHLNTGFRAQLDDQVGVDLELAQVKGYTSNHEEQTGMERFSLFFQGPKEPYLPQKLYPFKHDLMGDFDLFLVPIGLKDQGYEYEAVFNYFKNS